MEQFLNSCLQVLALLLNIPAEVWYFVLGAAGVSAVTQVLKKMFALSNEKVVVTVFTLISFVASGIEYLATQADIPPTILGVNTVILMGIATPLYRFVIKPLSNFITAVRTYDAAAVARMREVEALNAAASIPNSQVIDKGDEATIVATVDKPDDIPPAEEETKEKIASF